MLLFFTFFILICYLQVSDVDDTIKESGVLDKSILFQQTFLNTPVVAPGMASLYRDFKTSLTGTSSTGETIPFFMYLSASPWQLYPFLRDFIEENKFPEGQLFLNELDILTWSPKRLFQHIQELKQSKEYKIKKLIKIHEMFPKRKMILIGDLGEFDRDAYATIYTMFPGWVKCIYLREVHYLSTLQSGVGQSKLELQAQRNNKIQLDLDMKQVPKEVWTTFKIADEIDPNILAKSGKCY